MDRVIKFRGKDINGNWYMGLLSKSQGIMSSYPAKGLYISNSCGMPWAYQVRPESVGQFTGLLDKNSKEIYEGDIVHCWGGEQDGGKWQYNENITIKDMFNDCFRLGENEYIEIIGNIYDSEVQNG